MAVRITQANTNRTYLKNLNNAQYAMNNAMERVETGRDFTKVSQNVTSGTRAIDVRSRLYKNEQAQDNVNTANEQLAMAEDAIMEMNDIASSVNAEMFKALNTHTLEAGREAFLAYLDEAKDEILRLSNTKYNNKYVMGGLGVGETPYKVDKDGCLTFNGVKASDIKEENGKYIDAAGKEVPYSGKAFMDIGLDISVKDGAVNPKTAYKVSVEGIEVLGHGKSEVKCENDDGTETTYEISNNLYDMMTQMGEALKESDTDELRAILQNFKAQTENVITGVSEIGVRTKFLDTTLTRLENENYSLTKMQKDIEGVDDATEITNYLGYKNSWSLVMQFGSSVIPKSLMDYVT